MAVATVREDVGEARAVRSAEQAEALLLEVVQRHADELLRVARAHSLCADDAHDAYQRSLEQFVKCGRRLERATAHAWLFTVLRREARAIRASRMATETFDAVDPERLEARHDPSPEERALDADAIDRGALALRALKPQEARALWLRADGRSYAEIQAVTGWTYTKVNRTLTEGRRAFLRRCAELEAGTGCARWRPALAAVACGDAGAQELAELRPHLRRCAACRATLRGLHASSASVATVLPPGLVGVAAVGGATPATGWAARAHDAVAWLGRAGETLLGSVHERAVAGAASWPGALEAASSAKVAAVAASTVALAGGGAVVAHERAPQPPGHHRGAGTHATGPGSGTARRLPGVAARTGVARTGAGGPTSPVVSSATGPAPRPRVTGRHEVGGAATSVRAGGAPRREFPVPATGGETTAAREFGASSAASRASRSRQRTTGHAASRSVAPAARAHTVLATSSSPAPAGTEFARAPATAPPPPSPRAAPSPAPGEFGP